MRLLSFIQLLEVLILTVKAQEMGEFLARHKADIDNFVMAGYGKGWSHCDIVTEYYHEGGFLETVPQLVMELEKLQLSQKNASSFGNILIQYSLGSTFIKVPQNHFP